VYIPPLATTLLEHAGQIRAVVTSLTPNLLSRMWTKLEYRFDVCCVITGTLIEHL
jgi:hypothetical protein